MEELAAYLKMSRTKLYAMTQKGEIPASKIGNQWRFDRDEIDEWMKNKKFRDA
jgi:excisionase family DNA binding protein